MIALALVMTQTPSFAGDRITELSTMLSSSSQKTRLSAVLSLARLGDKRAMKPLVTALRDPSAEVRAIAANALGKLGHQAAYPALKSAANDDVDATVRTTAKEAALAVAKANNIKDEFTDPPVAQAAAVKTSGFGRNPHAVEERPDLYVSIKGANDDSPGKADKASRKQNAEIVKAALQRELSSAPLVTMAAADGQRWRLDPRMIDVSIVKLEVTQTTAGEMEVSAELRLAISDERGKLLSFLSGGAAVQVPLSRYSAKYLPTMRRDAIEAAMKGMMDKLLAHLRQITTT